MAQDQQILHHTGIENTTSVARLIRIQEGNELLRKSFRLLPLRCPNFEEETMSIFHASKFTPFSRRREGPASVSSVKATTAESCPSEPLPRTRLRALDGQPSPPFSEASRRELRMHTTSTDAATLSLHRRCSERALRMRSPSVDVSPLMRRASSLRGFPSRHASEEASGAVHDVASGTYQRPIPPIRHVMTAMREHEQTAMRDLHKHLRRCGSL
ncbi:hypothetical protein T484DRAFT_1957996 [Baffinella frigidus]|nr:hypothetical protein T484DRAFT_1957996 [Cryptophyta sp. CCMP2293]